MSDEPEDEFSVEAALGELREKVETLIERADTLIGQNESLGAQIEEALNYLGGKSKDE